VVGDLGPSAIWCLDYQFCVSICPSASVLQTWAGISRLSEALDSEHCSSFCNRCHLLYILSYGPLFETPATRQKAHDPPRFWTRVIQQQQCKWLEGFAPYLCLFHNRIPHLIEMSQMFSRLSIVRPQGQQQQNWDPIPSNLDTDLGEDLSIMIVLLNEIRVVSFNWRPTPVNVSGCYFEELSERFFLRIKCQNQGCGRTPQHKMIARFWILIFIF
jgi:hypothetical protein